MKEIFKLHWFCKSIVSDHDSKFTLEFWKILHREVGSKLNLNTAYHQKFDVQT